MRHSRLFILLIAIAASIGLMGGVLASGVIGARLAESCTPGVPEAMSSMWVKGTLFIALPIVSTALGGLGGWLLLLQLTHPAYRNGHCSGCGYNLRDLDADGCPECGKPIAPPTTETKQAHA